MLWRLFQLVIVLGVVAVDFFASRDSDTQPRPDLAFLIGMALAYVATVFVVGVLNVVTLLRGRFRRAAVAGAGGLEPLAPHVAQTEREHGELRLRSGGEALK